MTDETFEDTLEEVERLRNITMLTERNLVDPNISIQTNFPENCGTFADVISDECNLSKIYQYPISPPEQKQTVFNVSLSPWHLFGICDRIKILI